MIRLTMENIASVSSLIARARVAGIRAARWNTPDGARPASTRGASGAAIFRPTDLAVDEVLNGSTGDSGIVVRLLGGQVGCDRYSDSPTPEIEVGSEYDFFLGYSINSDGSKSSDLGVIDAFEGTVVRTREERLVPVGRLAEIVQGIPPAPLP